MDKRLLTIQRFFGTENACFLTEDKIYVILEKKIVEVLK